VTDNNKENNSENTRESIFQIMDNIMIQMSTTKKMFLVMVLTILILPPIGLIMMTSVFDNPFYPDTEGSKLHEEWEEKSYQLRDILLEIGSLPPEQQADNLEKTLQSAKYIELSSRIQELSEEFGEFERDPPQKEKPPVKPLQLIIFVISGIWLGIGIRQWYIFTKWDSKYKNFKQKQDELERKLDEEPEDNGEHDNSANN